MNRELALLASRVGDAMPTLTPEEQRLALEVYRRLAGGAPVASDGLAQRLGSATEWVDETLGRWPGVYRDKLGRVIGFWGLALGPLPPHRLVVEGRELWTWCSWDSLFIPILLGTSARVDSVCATTGTPIAVEVTPTGLGAVSPPDGLISFLRPQAQFDESVITSFCHHVLFFSSREAGEAWTATRPDALLLTLADGFELGRLVLASKYEQINGTSSEAA